MVTKIYGYKPLIPQTNEGQRDNIEIKTLALDETNHSLLKHHGYKVVWPQFDPRIVCASLSSTRYDPWVQSQEYSSALKVGPLARWR